MCLCVYTLKLWNIYIIIILWINCVYIKNWQSNKNVHLQNTHFKQHHKQKFVYRIFQNNNYSTYLRQRKNGLHSWEVVIQSNSSNRKNAYFHIVNCLFFTENSRIYTFSSKMIWMYDETKNKQLISLFSRNDVTISLDITM